MYHRASLQIFRIEVAFSSGYAVPKPDETLIKTITGPARENGAVIEPFTHHVYR